MLFGAGRPLGRLIASAALREGHQVTAFVRLPAQPIMRHDRLAIIQGDVLDAASVAAVVPGHDIVVGALGPSKQASAGRFRHPAIEHLVGPPPTATMPPTESSSTGTHTSPAPTSPTS